ncbi:arsenic transporter [Helicobacter sp. MIT 05-5293]|uniref:arsenic transporter n=1 Tax=Helicobacter sp. MIT 05-5293 TaxID=1548149 RepID=UPI00051D218B|nr:arsenic transporter [Helicobacter sp. MIT 05-5293]TLD82048.1 arsenic transporter [Helicobacter sp. MIT 05-5293]
MAYCLFVIVMLLIYWRPFNIPLWAVSTLGAGIALMLGIVSVGDVWFVWGMVWDSTLVLVGLIVLTLAMERIGFFAYLAHKIIIFAAEKREKNRFSRQYDLDSTQDLLQIPCKSAKLFVFLVFFGAFLATFLANDGAILVLTPLMFALFPYKNESIYTPLILFLLFMSFISDFASNLFVLSNLTNILTASVFGISFVDFVRFMALPQLFAILSSLLIFWVVLGKKLPETLMMTSNFKADSISNFGIFFCFLLLILLPIFAIVGAYFKIPLSLFVGVCAILALGYGVKIQKIMLFSLLKDSPFSVVVFSVGLFVVVFGLKNAGLLDDIRIWIIDITTLGKEMSLLCIGFLSALGSSLINNLPMVMLGDLALKDNHDLSFVFAHLLGCNIGAKLTPIGSLATLLWLANLRRYGVKIPLFKFLKLAFVFSVVVLFCAILGLVLSVALMDFD